MTDLEIFFMVLSLAMAFAASLFAYDCRRKEEEIKIKDKEIAFLSEMLKQSLLPEETIAELAKRAAENLVNDERDLVPVVRCKDCKHLGSAFACMFYGEVFTKDDFCSKGEKKT